MNSAAGRMVRTVSVKRSVKSNDRRQRATEGPKVSSRDGGQDIVVVWLVER